MSNHMKKSSKHLLMLGIFLAVLLGNVTAGLGKPIARETQLGDAIQILKNDAGGAVLETFRIYRYIDMRYFAAGVGKIERQATYPKFPLKLVFSGPGGAYLALVSVIVRSVDGDDEWRIPASHVTGPWLFLDLSPGRYRIEVGRGNDVQTRDKVVVASGRQKTIHFRWP